MAADHSEVAMFVATLLHSSTVAHMQHWSTNNYSRHKALGHYYKRIIERVDEYAESYMGRYERLVEFDDKFAHYQPDPIIYLSNIQRFVDESREHLPTDRPLQNLIDEIAQLIATTLYKLKNLE